MIVTHRAHAQTPDDVVDGSGKISRKREGIHLRPADVVCVVFPLVFSLMLIATTPVSRLGPFALIGLFSVSAGSLICRWIASQSRHPIAQAVGSFYSILVFPATYVCLNPIIDAISPVTYDRELQALDDALFRMQPAVAAERFAHPWLTEILYISYAAFFFWQIVLGIVLYRRKNRDFDDYFLTVVVFFMLSFVSYVLTPAIGPRYDLSHRFQEPLRAVWIGDAIQASFFDLPAVRDCFPSGHTGLTLLVLFRAWTKKAYGFFWIMLPFGLLLIVSTIYCRFHYATDLLAALPFIVGVLWIDAALRKTMPQGLVVGWPWRMRKRPTQS